MLSSSLLVSPTLKMIVMFSLFSRSKVSFWCASVSFLARCCTMLAFLSELKSSTTEAHATGFFVQVLSFSIDLNRIEIFSLVLATSMPISDLNLKRITIYWCRETKGNGSYVDGSTFKAELFKLHLPHLVGINFSLIFFLSSSQAR